MSLELLSLTALSPLDGRYGRQTAELREVFSEFAFMRERLRVEIEWLVGLSTLGLAELPPLAEPLKADLRQLVVHFSIEDCTEIKAIEARMTADGFYDDRSAADLAISRHQQLMWEVGDLMNRWETLQGS